MMLKWVRLTERFHFYLQIHLANKSVDSDHIPHVGRVIWLETFDDVRLWLDQWNMTHFNYYTLWSMLLIHLASTIWFFIMHFLFVKQINSNLQGAITQVNWVQNRAEYTQCIIQSLDYAVTPGTRRVTLTIWRSDGNILHVCSAMCCLSACVDIMIPTNRASLPTKYASEYLQNGALPWFILSNV